MAFNLLLKPQLERVINTLEPQIHTYAVSSTARNVVDKVAVLNGFILGSGAKVLVKFTDTTTTDPSSGNITLNVNSTGAKTVKISETDEICTYENASAFCDNKVYEFVYDGTNWIWIANTILDADVLITTNEFESLIPSSGSEITSLASWFSTENSMQNSQIASLSSSASEMTSTVSSLATAQSTIDSTQNSSLSSLSIASSELSSEIIVLSSEVANKQDELTAGTGISITNNVISASLGISITVVQILPSTDISTDTLYLIPSESAETNNIYDEYIYVNNSWELIGSTAIDLTDYCTTSEVSSILNSMSTVQNSLDSTQTNNISSLSSSASELASAVSSLSTSQSEIDSNQNSLISSLSTANSEFTSELNILGSEVADKQDELTAGKGITLANDVINADTNIFYGTLSEWDELTSVQKANYDYISTPEEDVVDNDSGWLQVGTSGLYYRKVYKTLFIRFSNISITRDGNVAIVETLPQEYRPSYDFLGTAFYSSYGATKATLVVNTNGTVYLSGLAYETATTLSNVYGYAVGVI